MKISWIKYNNKFLFEIFMYNNIKYLYLTIFILWQKNFYYTTLCKKHYIVFKFLANKLFLLVERYQIQDFQFTNCLTLRL